MKKNKIIKKNNSKKNEKRLIFFLFFAVFLIAYVFYGNTAVTVSRYDINSKEIPPAFDGFRIVQISDIHNSGNSIMIDSLIKSTVESRPDIIFLTGDAIDSYFPDVDAAMSVINRLNDIAPVYYVIGNHEARTGDYYRLSKEMHRIGVAELSNSFVNVRLGDDEIVIAGINDPRRENKDGNGNDAQIVSDWLGSLKYDRQMYTILLSHRPELVKTYVTHGVNLIFTGHAHGGLVRIPFLGGLYAPNQGLFPKYYSGLYYFADTTMIVNRGVGNSGYSFRINDNPEIVVAVLHAG